MAFEVTVVDTNAPVQEGNDFDVTVSVDNSASSSDTQDVTLTVGGTQRDVKTVDLGANGGTTITLTWNTAVGDAGTYEFAVSSDDTTDTGDVTVEEAPQVTFDVVVTGSNSPVTVGGTLTVDADITNSGQDPGSQVVTLTVGGQERASTEVTLENGQTKPVSLSWATGDGDAGTYDAVVASEDDQGSTDVTVEDDSGGTDPEIPLDVTIDWTNGPITAGEPLCLDCTATNTGDTAGVGTVAVGLDNQAEPKKNWELALAPGESGTVHLSVEQDSYREGNDAEYAKKVWADTGTSRAETTVSVSEPPHFAVDIVETNAPVEAGEKIKLTATVENTGGQTGHETVALAAKEYVNSISNAGSIRPGGGGSSGGGDSPVAVDRHGPLKTGKFIVDATGLDLPPGESTEVTLEWDTGPSTDAVEPGEYALGVAAIPPWERDEWDGPVFGRACTDGTRNDSTVVAIQHGPMRTGRFKVELDGEELAGPARVNIPARSTEQDSYKEGGDGETEWGRTGFDDLEMSRGVNPGNTRLYDWHEAVEEGNVDSGRKSVTVKLLDEDGNPMIQWELQEAWIKEYDPPELDAGSDAMAQEEITIAFDKMTRK
jgi:phage tail-like protein